MVGDTSTIPLKRRLKAVMEVYLLVFRPFPHCTRTPDQRYRIIGSFPLVPGSDRNTILLGNRREQALGDFGNDVNLRIDDFGDVVTHTGAEDHSDFGGVEFVLLLEPSR